jgi:general secretion pathway protein D
MRTIAAAICWPAAVVCVLAGPAPARADPEVEIVAIDYPEELPLEALVDYVSQTLNVKVVYGDELRKQEVILRPGHVELPKDRLLDLLRAVLQLRGLALVETELPGFFRITTSADVQRLTGDIREGPPAEDVVPGRVVTQVIAVPSGDTKGVAAKIASFTSSAKSSIIEVPERGTILLTDYEPVVARIARLVELIDTPAEPMVTEVVKIAHQDPAKMASQVAGLIRAEQADRTRGKPEVLLTPGVVSDSLIVTGTRADVDRAIEWIHRLDVRRDELRPLRVYTPEHTSAERIRGLIENVVLGPSAEDKKGVQVFTDEATNRLYVTAPPDTQREVSKLIREEDRPAPPASRRMRIYRPCNRTAGEILDTLTQLLEEATVTFASPGGELATGEVEKPAVPGPNRPPVAPGQGQVPPMPPAQEPVEAIPETQRGARRVEGPDYVLTEDEPTNSIIAIGAPEFHSQLEELINELDRRRAQVLIEMTLVAVSRNDSLSLGFELEALDLGEPYDYLLFSSFGLSDVDVATGQRALAPGVGVNGVLIAPDEIPILFRALATHGKSHVLSTPRVVVADNTAGTLRNVEEAPFTSVNASDTVATTSFAGFESAGTTLTVTPHVAEGDHLTLQYNLTFSSFAGSPSSATVPPPRTTNSFSGEVEVPDGYTVVVGGLEVQNESDTVSEVPLLGRIPGRGLLFQNNSMTRTRSRVFAFIRPVILRDDQFADLKFLSAEALKRANVENRDFPADRPMWMR